MTKLFKCLNTVHNLDDYSTLIRTNATHKQANFKLFVKTCPYRTLEMFRHFTSYKALNTISYYKLYIRIDIVGF